MRPLIFGPHCMCSCGEEVWNIVLVVMWNDECSVGIRHIALSQRVKVLEVCYDDRLDDTTWHCRIFKAESLSMCDNALLICKASCSLTLPSTCSNNWKIMYEVRDICSTELTKYHQSLNLSFSLLHSRQHPSTPPPTHTHTLPQSPLSAPASSAWDWTDGI